MRPTVAGVQNAGGHALGPQELLGSTGAVVARVEVADRADWLQADVTWTSPGETPASLAAVLTAAFGGMRVATTDDDLAAALVAAGGTVARRGTQMEYDVRRSPPLSDWLDRTERDGVCLVDYRLVDDEIATAWLAAYPPSHPDHDAALTSTALAVADLGAAQTDEVPAFFPEASALALGPTGEVLSGVMVNLMRPNPLWSGPWVPDLFVRPDAQRRGIASRLMRFAVAAVGAAGHDGLALSVTEGNPARAVYEQVGFVATVTFTSVTIPLPTPNQTR